MLIIGEAVAEMGKVAVEAAGKAAEVSAQAVESAGEVATGKISETAQNGTIVIEPDMTFIMENSLKSLMVSNAEGSCQGANEISFAEKGIFGTSEGQAIEGGEITPELDASPLEKVGLSDEQKALIAKETGWPSEIVDCIESTEQYEIYKNAELKLAEVDGRLCLIKDINMDYVDPKTGLTNRELMEDGRSPIDANTGEKIELHHMGQDFNSPFVELCENSEHGDGNDGILHDKKIESWRQDQQNKNAYNNTQRPNHWKERAMEVKI